jgi:hypothetical protein
VWGLSLIVLALAWPFVGAPRVNDFRLWRVERSFDSVKHPSGTRLVMRIREVGLLIGNSNHCDYFVGELRSYSGEPERIKAAYAGARVWEPIPEGAGEVRVVFPQNGKVPNEDAFTVPYLLEDSADWGVIPKFGEKLYYVYFLSAGQDPGFDFRCH